MRRRLWSWGMSRGARRWPSAMTIFRAAKALDALVVLMKSKETK